MLANAKNGISSYEVHRAIGVTQKTAWFMLHRIRLAMQEGTIEKLSGEVEADETYIGGKMKNMHRHKQRQHGRGTGGLGKAIVMGLLQRQGRVKAKHIFNAKRRTVQGEIRQHVEPGSQVFTDELRSYNGLERDFIHQAINHAICYARGNVHTNGLENFWSLLKRCIKGTYVSVDPAHLFRYLDEQVFRFNLREGNDASRFMQVVKSVIGRKMTYAELTGTRPESA